MSVPYIFYHAWTCSAIILIARPSLAYAVTGGSPIQVPVEWTLPDPSCIRPLLLRTDLLEEEWSSGASHLRPSSICHDV